MNKGYRRPALLLAVVLGCPVPVLADIIEKEVPGLEDRGFYVLQGSRNMRDLGKGRRHPSVMVPAVPSVETVIPALENAALRPKPRFGFGSDWQPGDEEPSRESSPESARRDVPISGPVFEPSVVYRFRYHYPIHREYYFGYPFRYHAPCSRPFFGGFGRAHRSFFFRFSIR